MLLALVFGHLNFKSRLDYQPLFGKMSPHSQDRTRETAEIEPILKGITAVCVLFLVKLRWPKTKCIYDIVSICGMVRRN